MLFPTHLMTMLLFRLFLCLFQIGYNLFNKAMSMTLPYLKSFKIWPVILLLSRITLGTVLLWDTRVALCFPRAEIFTRLSFMNSMLLQRRDTLGSSKCMSGHDVTSFGREWNRKFNRWLLNVIPSGTIRVKLHSSPACSNPFLSLQGFGQIFRWISLKGSLNLEGIW